MGILARIDAGKRMRAQTSTAFGPMDHEMVRRAFAETTSSGKAVDDKSSMRVSAAWCCRRILSESIGMLPWSMFEKDSNGNAEKAEGHWLQDVMVYSPNREQTKVEYLETQAMGLTGVGNAYSVIDRLGKRITSLTPIFGVTPKRKAGSNTKLTIPESEIFFSFHDRGKPVDLPREKVWHVKGFGSDPLQGLSPIGAAREAMGGALAMEDFAHKFFSQGGMPSGTVSFPGWLDPNQKIEAQEALERMVGGLGNAHRVALFQGGMKPEPWNTMNLEEMQFIFGRKFSVLEICRFYRVPPHMVAELEKGASYASIEQMSMEFVMFTLMPYLTRFEASVTKWLLPVEERRKFFLRFNYEGLLRADSKGRAEMYASALQNGWMNRNQVRAKENENRIEGKGMDDFTVQSNLVRVEDLGKIAEAAREKPAPTKPSDMIFNFGQPSLVLNQTAADLTVNVPKSDVTVNVPKSDVTVNVPKSDVTVNVPKSDVTVNVPKSELTVNVPEREVHFEMSMPEIKASDVHVDVAAPVVNVAPAEVKVDVHPDTRDSKTTYERDPETKEVVSTTTTRKGK